MSYSPSFNADEFVFKIVFWSIYSAFDAPKGRQKGRAETEVNGEDFSADSLILLSRISYTQITDLDLMKFE